MANTTGFSQPNIRILRDMPTYVYNPAEVIFEMTNDTNQTHDI